MSSPGTSHGFPQWQTPPLPGPPAHANNEVDEDGVSVRPMRLKVLYTFDDENKTNCLARGNDVLQIKTVALDETATIGIIELKTCIELVVQSSPELIARLGQDYTIYAYDYSEYDTPLVGQGMLSRALASSSPAPDAPAHQNQKLITGRVCKNILGIFNNGVKETLEVKLRLVPVPTAMQGEYVSQMEKYREMTRAAGFDSNEWAAFLQSNPGLGQMAGKMGGSQTGPSRSGSINMEVVNQLLSPSLSQPQIDPFNQANAENSGNETRGSTSNGGKAKNTSRPSSRASVKRPRKPRQPKTAAVGGNTSGYEEGTDGDDGPAPKKRAKITKTDWNSKSSFGPASDSLRVTASTAGSLRLFRPIAMATNTPGHLEELPRAPTPVPDMPQNSARGRAQSQSALRCGSTVSQVDTPRNHLSPSPHLDPADELRYSIESAGPSPERQSLAETPPDIGSSPPVMRTASPLPSSPPCPSSPILPQMPRNDTDSGFMSGTLDDLFGEDDETLRRIDDEVLETVAEYGKRDDPAATEVVHHGFEIQQENPGPVELLPTRMPVWQPPQRTKAAPKPPRSRAGSVMSEDGQQTLPPLKNGSRLSSRRATPTFPATGAQVAPAQGESQSSAEARLAELLNSPKLHPHNNPQSNPTQDPRIQSVPPHPSAAQSRPASRTMVRTASLGSLTLPTVPTSDPVLPPSSLQRSQTWSEAPHPATEASINYIPYQMAMYPPPDPAVIAAELSRAQALEAKKAAMRQKLEDAIANGVMPPFCSNCGAIETPAWRKAWSQDIQGAPPYYEYSDEPGRVTTIVILGRDEQGNPTSYQLIKKFLLPEESQEDYKEVILCNPCGIWMSKYKSHRPEEKWECNRNKKPAEKKRGVQRPTKPKKAKTNGSMNPTSEANYLQSEAYFPQSEAVGPTEDVSQDQQAGRQRSTSARPVKRLHAMTSDAASAALRRALQSSPARWAGTAHSPIDVEEEDLGSTRRLLFPSPRKDGSPKALGEIATNVVTIATDFRSPKEAAVEVPNKENCRPAADEDDCEAEILRLFEEEMARPTTPVGKSPTQNPFKTPTRPTPNHRPITRSVSRSIRSAKSPGQLLLFQKTPSKTPGSCARRRSPRNHNFESPFTATLNQIMSDANERHSSSRGMQLDFSNLPDLPQTDTAQHGNYSLEDFFSTDVPMPSSPPRLGYFHLYEDPLTMSNMDWNDFSDFDTSMLDKAEKDVKIKKEPGTGDESEELTQPTETSEKQPSSS